MKPIITSQEQALALLDDREQSNFLRESAAHFLAEHPTLSIIRRLVEALQDDDNGVRWAASMALSKMGEAGLLELLKALADPDRVGDPRLRSGAFHMLRASGIDPLEVAPLLQALGRWTLADMTTLIEADRLLQQRLGANPVNIPSIARPSTPSPEALSGLSSQVANLRILVSGAGVAGLTLAYWLKLAGFAPSIVEKRPGLQDPGYMIDFYGSGFDVAEKMGLLGPLRARHYPVESLKYVDEQGATQAAVDLVKFRKLLNFRHFNFMRGDLEQVLHETAMREAIPIRFNTRIVHIIPQPNDVQVQFSDGTSQEFDLVIGADGIHSGVRRLIWGDDHQFTHFLGYYIACGIIPDQPGLPDGFYGHIEPGKQASVYSIRGGQMATFLAFKSGFLDLQSRDQQLAALTRVFGDTGWIAPQLVQAMRRSPDIYFDAVSQIDLPSWHQGRVALVGDACQCLTPLAGQGASMAMAGAYLLATELQRAHGDYVAAFQAYEEKLKPEIAARQLAARKLARSFIPENRWSIWMTNLFLRAAFLPGFDRLVLSEIGANIIIK